MTSHSDRQRVTAMRVTMPNGEVIGTGYLKDRERMALYTEQQGVKVALSYFRSPEHAREFNRLMLAAVVAGETDIKVLASMGQAH